MPHIDIKLIGNPSDKEKKIVAEKIAKVIELKENVKKEIRKKYQSVEINCIL